MNTARFPILWPAARAARQELEALGCPRSVLWPAVAPHEKQALENHGQTLERLAQRGGLSPRELLAVLRGVGWHDVHEVPLAEAVQEILEQTASTLDRNPRGPAMGRVSDVEHQGGRLIVKPTKERS